MFDEFKLLTALDSALFAMVIIFFRYFFNRFTKLEQKVNDISDIRTQLKLIEFRLDHITKSIESITKIKLQNDN